MEENSKNGFREDLKREFESIKATLEEAGVYDPSLDVSIEKAATDLLIYRKLRNACLAEETPLTFTEKSREGDSRIKVNPIFNECGKQSKVVGDAFDKLLMNAKAKGKKVGRAGDKLTKLMNDYKSD